MIIEHLKKVDSTNEYITKYVKKRQNAIVVAQEQTAGKGTKGRSFISQKGGLYLSKLTFHSGLKGDNGWQIMAECAMGVVKTLLSYGINAQIKWPNDIIVNGKKICGILIRNAFVGDEIDYSLVGIGVNVNNDIAPEIEDIAISVKQVLSKEIDLNAFFLTLTLNLGPTTMQEYKSFSCVLGKKITVIRKEEKFECVAKDILPNGGLLLSNGEILYAGEIDLKISLNKEESANE